MPKIACAHPGKIGDALYALPTIKKLCEKHGCKADFFTSEYCLPMKRLVEYQPYIDKLIVPKDYKLEGFGCGGQPWHMPIPPGYEAAYQLGFRSNPDRPLPEFIAASADVSGVEINYHFSSNWLQLPAAPFIVLAARGHTGFPHLFQEFIKVCPLRIVQIGGKGDFIGDPLRTTDYTGLDMLDTVALLSKASGFVGVMSSQLVLANGFPIPKVVPNDGIRWDMRHVIQGPNNHYPLNPSAQDIVQLLGIYDLL